MVTLCVKQDPNITCLTVKPVKVSTIFKVLFNMNAVVFPAEFGVTKTQFERKSID